MKRNMKRNSIILLACAILLSGCANAQTQGATVEKNTDQMVEIALAGMEPTANATAAPTEATQTPAARSPLYEKLGAPERYLVPLSPKTDKLAITVDADVILPNAEGMPTVRIEARDFTQEEVTLLFRALCGDTIMYRKRTQSTRAEIQERIDDVREEMKTATGDRLKKLQENLAYYEEDYQNAPETITDEVTDGTLYEKQLGIQEYLAKYMALEARECPEDTSAGKMFSVSNNYYDINTSTDYGFTTGADIVYAYRPMWGSAIGLNPAVFIQDESVVPAVAAGELSITPLKARQMVEAFWKEIGFADMAVSGVYLADNHSTENRQISEQDPYGEKYAYAVTCGKSVNGIVPVSTSAMYEGQNWNYECCYFFVSDEGIQTFQWSSPNTYLETITEETAMLPFSRIDEIFRKMMLVKYENSTAECSSCKLFSYAVNRVALEWQRVFEQGSNNKGLLIPVWNFYGSFDFQYTNGDHFGSSEVEQGFPEPLLTINAIDGSIIDLREGY